LKWRGRCFTQVIIALGDFNLPKAVVGDPIFDQLTAPVPLAADAPKPVARKQPE
jgi:hypothetical protein